MLVARILEVKDASCLCSVFKILLCEMCFRNGRTHEHARKDQGVYQGQWTLFQFSVRPALEGSESGVNTTRMICDYFSSHSKGHSSDRATPAQSTSMVNICPVRGSAIICAGPRHSVATMHSVFISAPPSAQEKQPRSRLMVCNTSPPSRTREQRLLGTSPYQIAFSASRQIPSGTASPRSPILVDLTLRRQPLLKAHS